VAVVVSMPPKPVQGCMLSLSVYLRSRSFRNKSRTASIQYVSILLLRNSMSILESIRFVGSIGRRSRCEVGCSRSFDCIPKNGRSTSIQYMKRNACRSSTALLHMPYDFLLQLKLYSAVSKMRHQRNYRYDFGNEHCKNKHLACVI